MCKYHFRFSSLLLVSAAILCAGPAGAQTVCGGHAKFTETLAQKYEEMPSAYGIVGQRNLVELFVSKTGTWTMLVTRPDGTSCVLATGQSWEQVPLTAKTTGL